MDTSLQDHFNANTADRIPGRNFQKEQTEKAIHKGYLRQTTTSSLHNLIAKDLARRLELSKKRYGTGLQAFNGRNALLDAYEEILDLAVYLKQRLVEEGAGEVRDR